MAQTNDAEANDKNQDQNGTNNRPYVRVLAFYNKHFPTDKKTYSIRLPLIGLVFSILCLHIVVTFWGRNAYEGNQLVILSYILLSTGVAYELYWGFNVGDRKQYTPWIILKAVEITLTFGHLIFEICDPFQIRLELIIFGFIFLFINTYITYSVIVKSFQIFRGDSDTNYCNRNGGAAAVDDENIYDFQSDEVRSSFRNNV